MSEWNNFVFETIVAFRGTPDKCDFCEHIFKDDDQVIPEEAKKRE